MAYNYPLLHLRVMVVIATITLDPGVELRSCQVRNCIRYFSADHAALKSKSKKNGWLGIIKMCLSGAICLPVVLFQFF